LSAGSAVFTLQFYTIEKKKAGKLMLETTGGLRLASRQGSRKNKTNHNCQPSHARKITGKIKSRPRSFLAFAKTVLSNKAILASCRFIIVFFLY
jgi:hypothetical protein